MYKNATCICSMSHQGNDLPEVWPKRFTKENYDSFVIIDTSKDTSTTKGFLYNENSLREDLNFPHQVSNRHYWNSYGNRNIIWFYAHLRMMNFYLKYPNYDFYWFFDDDVKINDWNEFLTQTDKNEDDFISYIIFKKPGVESQPNVPHMDNRTTSQHMWFERFPGHTDTLPEDIKEYFGSFFPTTRYSNRSMKKLVELNNEGYFGYSEGFVPTVLNHYGMTLHTLIDSNNNSKLIDINNIKILHKDTKIDWEWI